jgi:hypothetical protein
LLMTLTAAFTAQNALNRFVLITSLNCAIEVASLTPSILAVRHQF